MPSPESIDIAGRPRPVEVDALRLLVAVHQLGEPEASGDRNCRIDGESLLCQLDHLVRHPVTVAYLLIDAFGRHGRLESRRSEMARKVRQLLAVDRQQRQPTGQRRPWNSAVDALEERRRLHPFVAPRWVRLDEPVAFLSMRGLMTVEVAPGHPPGHPTQILYALTPRGTDLLENQVYPKYRDAALQVQTCEALAELLPLLLSTTDRRYESDSPSDPGEALEGEIEAAGLRLEAQAQKLRIPPERDPLSELFSSTFRERL